LFYVVERRFLTDDHHSRLSRVIFRERAQLREVARDAAIRVLDDFAEREEWSVLRRFLFSFENDLSECCCSDVILRFIVDDHHVFIRANHFSNVVECDVAALLCVVEFAVLVALNDFGLGARSAGSLRAERNRVLSLVDQIASHLRRDSLRLTCTSAANIVSPPPLVKRPNPTVLVSETTVTTRDLLNRHTNAVECQIA